MLIGIFGFGNEVRAIFSPGIRCGFASTDSRIVFRPQETVALELVEVAALGAMDFDLCVA